METPDKLKRTGASSSRMSMLVLQSNVELTDAATKNKTKKKQNENTSSAGDKFGPDPMIQSSPLLRASAGFQSKRPREEMHVGGGYFDQPIDRANGGESQWGADGRGSTSRRHCLAPIHLSRTRVSSQNSRVPVAPCPSVSR